MAVIVGAAAFGVGRTVTVIAAKRFSIEPLMIVDPDATAVIRPATFTVATSG